MYEIDFEIHVEAPDLEGEAFMAYVDDHLYEKYQGDLSPVVRDGELYVLGTTESADRRFTEAVLPVLRDLEAIGFTMRGFEIVREMELV